MASLQTRTDPLPIKSRRARRAYLRSARVLPSLGHEDRGPRAISAYARVLRSDRSDLPSPPADSQVGATPPQMAFRGKPLDLGLAMPLTRRRARPNCIFGSKSEIRPVS